MRTRDAGAGAHGVMRALVETGRRLGGCAVCLAAFMISLVALLYLKCARRGRPAAGRARDDKLTVLITGRFDSRNWAASHVVPLLKAPCVGSIHAVIDGPVVDGAAMHRVATPAILRRLFGRAIGRSLWTLWVAGRLRPDIIMGYHFFPAGLTAVVAAHRVGASSVYQMTGGPVEIVGAGLAMKTPLLPTTTRLSDMLQRMAKRIAGHMDLVVVRGRKARRYLERHTPVRRVAIIAGSVNMDRFSPADGPRTYDLVYVGRLEPVKRPTMVLRVVHALKASGRNIRAAVVGDGSLRETMARLVDELDLHDAVDLLGHREDVDRILADAKVFILTSRSEGLSIAMAEAMAAGAVPVVADVGDLGDLVANGRTGWLVPPTDIGAYARRIGELLDDEPRRRRIAAAARRRAIDNNAMASVIARWDRWLTAVAPAPPREPSRGLRSLIDLHGRNDGARRVARGTTYARWREWTSSRWGALAARAVEAVPARYALGYRFAAIRRFLAGAERRSARVHRRWQWDFVGALCRVAAERTPYYRRRFREAGVDPSRLTPETFAALPTLDREVVQQYGQDMLVAGADGRRAERVSTSGRSGAPLFFHINADRAAFEYAHLTAAWARAGYRVGMTMAVLRGKTVRRDADGLYHEYDPLLRHHYYSSFHMNDEHMGRYLEHIAGIGPCFLHVYPSTIFMLARFIRRTGVLVPGNIRGIIAESEIVYPQQRRTVEAVFGCRLFSCYGQSEKVVLACGCEHSDDYHVWPTYGYFELLDEAGRPVTEPGRRGEIVGTGFINTVMPFIRYRTGDWATCVSDHCDQCGRHHPVIRDIRGHRIQEALVAGDGTEISWTALNMHDDTFDHVRQFQFYQDTPGQAVLRAVVADGFDERDRRRILQNLGRKLDGQIGLTFEAVDAIRLTDRGKTVYVDQAIGGRRGAVQPAALAGEHANG